MTTTTATTVTTAGPSRTPLLAALGIATSAVLTAVGTFWDATGNDTRHGHATREYLVTLGIIVAFAALAYGLGVRTARRGNPGRRAVVFGVLAVVSFVAYWAGLPAVLASAAVACALAQKDEQGSFSTGSKAALALAAVGTAAAAVLAVVG
jgi:hypothetical protein